MPNHTMPKASDSLWDINSDVEVSAQGNKKAGNVDLRDLRTAENLTQTLIQLVLQQRNWKSWCLVFPTPLARDLKNGDGSSFTTVDFTRVFCKTTHNNKNSSLVIEKRD